MYHSIRLLTNANKELAYNMCLPGQLSWVGNMLPLATTVGQQRISRFNTLWGGAQDFQQGSTCMPPALLNNLYTHSFSRNTSWDKEDTSFIAAYGIATIGKVCKFNINTHIHLGRHLSTFSLVDVRSIFSAVCIYSGSGFLGEL